MGAAFSLSEPYRTRPIRYRRLWQQDGWQIKCYTIHHRDRPAPDEALLAAATAHAARLLPPAATPETYGAGFVILHAGREANFLLVDWWTGENMLFQALALAPLDAPGAFAPAPPQMTACVWELAVIGWERQAWLDTVLANPAGPDLNAYFARRLDADI